MFKLTNSGLKQPSLGSVALHRPNGSIRKDFRRNITCSCEWPNHSEPFNAPAKQTRYSTLEVCRAAEWPVDTELAS